METMEQGKQGFDPAAELIGGIGEATLGRAGGVREDGQSYFANSAKSGEPLPDFPAVNGGSES